MACHLKLHPATAMRLWRRSQMALQPISMSLLPGITVQTGMDGIDLGAMSQRHHRCVALAGCKWAQNLVAGCRCCCQHPNDDRRLCFHTHPFHQDWMGYSSPRWLDEGTPPTQDWMGILPIKTEQQSEDLLHEGQYTSCVHAGGLFS